MASLRMFASRLAAVGTTLGAGGYATYKYTRLNSMLDWPQGGACDYTKDVYEPPLEGVQDWNTDWDKRAKLQQEKEKAAPPPQPEKVVDYSKLTQEPTLPELEPPPPVNPSATRHVLLVRHGQYNMDPKSDLERHLTEVGRRQALMTGERLKTMDIKFDRVVASTMTRAQETANLICESIKDIPREDCSLLREGAPYPPVPESSLWKPSRADFFQDNPRIEGAFRKYFHRADPSQEEDSYDLVVCHGNVIRYFVCRALQFPPEGWLRMSVGHCGLTWITIRPNGRVSMRGLGDIGHLPPDIITR